MPVCRIRLAAVSALTWGLLLASGLPHRSVAQSSSAPPPTHDSTTITNLAQLNAVLGSVERLWCGVRLEVVVCASNRPGLGVLVVQDDTGLELLELGRLPEGFQPGDRLRIEGRRLLLRRRDFGTQISAAPIVDNDGLHGWRTSTGEAVLEAGWVPLELDWFNYYGMLGLTALWQPSSGPLQPIPDSALRRAAPSAAPGDRDLGPGLGVESYEGFLEKVPDFDLLRPVKTGITTNFDVGFRSRDDLVGLRFTGFLQVPTAGKYTFVLGSDDGSLLFIGPKEVPIQRLGVTPAPAPQAGRIGEPMQHLEERRWLSVQGRVRFAIRRGDGLELELCSGTDTLSVRVLDGSGLEPLALLNTSVRVAGVGRPALSADQRIVLDRLLVADGRGLTRVPLAAQTPGEALPLRSIGQVQALGIEDARRQLPVRIRGVVTSAKQSDHWISLQDDTRAIFVSVTSLSNTFPACAEVWEVVGHAAPGNFATIVVEEQIQRLGRGRMPEPTRPTWTELANGSMDVQWVEFQGLVSGVESNRLNLLMPEGPLEVHMEDYFEKELKGYQQAVIRLRGTLFAVWNADTREVQFGSLVVRNGSISVDTPPLADPFEAPAKSARELLQFDAHASALRPVKVRGQVLFADARKLFVADDGMGLRVLTTEAGKLQPGDLIEAVGYPEIGGPSPVLRQATVRKMGAAPLPPPRIVAEPELTKKGLEAARIRVEGRLIGLHSEQQSPVLELQSGGQLFVARVQTGATETVSARIGSRLQLTGVYAEAGGERHLERQVGAFELLVNSPADIRVLSQPSWWTLERLAVMVGLLIVVLLLAAGWISQLHRQVELRSQELQHEIHEREQVEHHLVLEAERARIARDLHDDLGASLTEIGALASTGQQGDGKGGNSSALLDTILGRARDSIAALDVIVWTVDPEHNSLQSVADYLGGFAGEYLAHSNIACRFKIPVTFPAIMLDGRVRHDLFLCVKETLSNVVRHARASEVEFRIAVAEGALEIAIADNGQGFDTTAPSEGNGLKNLRGRLAKLGGTYGVESRPGGGTSVTIRLGLPVPTVGADSDRTFDSYPASGKAAKLAPTAQT